MFDIGFSEIALVGVVALLVLGPERLPRVARTAGALVRRARASWQSMRDEIERELATEDLKKSMQDIRREVDVSNEIRSAAGSVEESLRSTASAVTAASPEPGKSGEQS